MIFVMNLWSELELVGEIETALSEIFHQDFRSSVSDIYMMPINISNDNCNSYVG